MRWLAWLLTPLTLAAAFWSGEGLYRAVQSPPADAEQAIPARLDETLALDVPEPQPPMRWPPLFGEFSPPEPQPPRQPEPPTPVAVEPPKPPAPPLDSLGFALKGVVSSGDTRWAIISHPTGERLVRVGDALSDNVTVTAIETGGLRVDNHGENAFLAFRD